MKKGFGKNEVVFGIAFSAMMIALAICFEVLCKVIPFLQMPLGGGISLAMLPLALVTVVCGVKYGICAGVAFGLINFLIDGYGFNLASFILDYIIGFTVISMIGIFRKDILKGKTRYFIFGFILGLLLRWIASGFSGVINAEVWGYNSEFLSEVFGEGKDSIIYLYIYSFILYNLPYMFISGALCIILGSFTYKKILSITGTCKEDKVDKN